MKGMIMSDAGGHRRSTSRTVRTRSVRDYKRAVGDHPKVRIPSAFASAD
jgi:hypothetical protein